MKCDYKYNFYQLQRYLTKLSIFEVLGICALVKVKPTKDKPFNQLINEPRDAFNATPRTRRKEIISIARAACSEDDINATKNS